MQEAARTPGIIRLYGERSAKRVVARSENDEAKSPKERDCFAALAMTRPNSEFSFPGSAWECLTWRLCLPNYNEISRISGQSPGRHRFPGGAWEPEKTLVLCLSSLIP